MTTPTTDLGANPDIGDIINSVIGRVYNLEQQISNPGVVGVTSANPTFQSVGITGPGGTVLLLNTTTPPTNMTLAPGSFFGDVYVDVSWVAPVDGSASSYELTYAKKNGDGTYQVANFIRTTSTTVRVSGLDPLATYGFRVITINRIGQMSPPLPATGFQDAITVPDATVPLPPTGLTILPGPSGVMLTWNDNTEADVAQGKGIYRLQVDTVNTFNSAGLIDKLSSASIVALTGLNPDATYYARVQAIDASGNASAWSATVSTISGDSGGQANSDGAAPATSPTPTVTGGVGFLFIKWSAVANADPVTYDVYLSTAAGTRGALLGSTSATNYVAKLYTNGTALQYNTTYYVTLVARDADGSAAAGGQVSGSLTPATTADIAVNAITAASGIIASLDAGKITTGSMSAAFLTAGTLTSDRVVAAGLDAGVIKFGTMAGDRITANTLDVGALKTSTLTTASITIAGGAVKVGNPGVAGNNGLLINSQGLRLYNGTTVTIALDTGTGQGTFGGNITSTATITGGTLNGAVITGGTYQTSSLATDYRFWVSSSYPGYAFLQLPTAQANTAGGLFASNYGNVPALYLFPPSNAGVGAVPSTGAVGTVTNLQISSNAYFVFNGGPATADVNLQPGTGNGNMTITATNLYLGGNGGVYITGSGNLFNPGLPLSSSNTGNYHDVLWNSGAGKFYYYSSSTEQMKRDLTALTFDDVKGMLKLDAYTFKLNDEYLTEDDPDPDHLEMGLSAEQAHRHTGLDRHPEGKSLLTRYAYEDGLETGVPSGINYRTGWVTLLPLIKKLYEERDGIDQQLKELRDSVRELQTQ